ncbi:MAG: amino acid permease [Deltaproteobacteria bacterium]|nr:MAG: amino acid permease [Deltaproteobacteria bacterium]
MAKNNTQTETVQDRQGTLGTFSGVFTPSVLTILGIILFLRLGYVVGNAGLGRALVILVLANSISILTSISLSAIATNIKVKGGGDYYLISRTLGPEFGGALGIVLFLAQSVSIGFYCIGFGEVLAQMLPLSNFGPYGPQLVAGGAVIFLFIFAWLGADWATRFQYVVMGILTAALISFFWGGIMHWDATNLAQNWRGPLDGPGFWILFAIFFPAVTGFTQGISMSGDLKDAGKSLPLGTFLAVGISIVVYFLAAVIFSASLPQSVLRSDYTAMKVVATFGFLVTAGVIAATLSSAMASFLGAPRILQSLASDRIFPFLLPFAKGEGATNNPRRGVLLASGIAIATIGLGNLNVIAPIVSMFFLISYGLLNYATYYETRAASPFFRPRFKWYDGRLSLLGGLSCLGVMLAIDISAGLISVAVLFSIYQYLHRTAGPARWADGKRSYHLQQVRDHLLAAAAEPEHPRDWRPQLLLFSDRSEKRAPLLTLAAWITGNTGLITVVQVIEERGAKAIKLQKETEKKLEKEIAAYEMGAFPLVVSASNFEQGVDMLVQTAGIGPLHTNTILFGWLSKETSQKPHIRKTLYDKRLKRVFKQGRNIIVLDVKEGRWEEMLLVPETERRIDVWWWDDATGRLMLLLAHLIARSKDWDDARIRVLSAEKKTDAVGPVENLKTFLDDVRIDAEPVELEMVDAGTVEQQSGDASLVLMPLQIKGDRSLGPFGEPVENIINRLPSVAMVLAAEDIDLEAEPEEGKAGEMASALDQLADTEKKAQKAEKEVEKASRSLDENLAQLSEVEKSETEPSKVHKMRSEVFDAEAAVEKAVRKAAKAEAKIRYAAQEAVDTGAKLPDELSQDLASSDDSKGKLPKLP